jgi:putative transposase
VSDLRPGERPISYGRKIAPDWGVREYLSTARIERVSRIARVVIPGIPHHIVQRGNRRQDVFFGDRDRQFYMHLLKKYGNAAGVTYWAYCLMDNHVHLVAVPKSPESFTRGLGVAHWKYTLSINIREDWRGYLWQGRFFSCPLDGRYLMAAIRYVEGNPVRAGLVTRAEDYPWSSARAHVFKHKDPLIEFCPVQHEIKDWSGFISIAVPERELKNLRKSTITGRPAGDLDFVERLETSTGRTLKLMKRGPKPRLPHA